MVIKSHIVSLLKTLPFSCYGLIDTDHRAVEKWKKMGGGHTKRWRVARKWRQKLASVCYIYINFYTIAKLNLIYAG